MTYSVWPSGCECQAVRAPGSNDTRVDDDPRRRFGRDDRILPDRAGEIFLGRAACRPRAGEMDIHGVTLSAFDDPETRSHALRRDYFFEAA